MPSEDETNRLRVALGRITKTVERRSAGQILTRTQLSVLGTVARARSLRLSELAEAEGINPTMLSRIVGKLEADGVLVRRADPDDRRSVVVEITASGARLHTRLRRERTRILADALGRLNAEQGAAVVAALPALEELADVLHPRSTAGAGAAR